MIVQEERITVPLGFRYENYAHWSLRVTEDPSNGLWLAEMLTPEGGPSPTGRLTTIHTGDLVQIADNLYKLVDRG